jgi:hypothetical protein
MDLQGSVEEERANVPPPPAAPLQDARDSATRNAQNLGDAAKEKYNELKVGGTLQGKRVLVVGEFGSCCACWLSWLLEAILVLSPSSVQDPHPGYRTS